MTRPQSVLVATDFSETSAAALRYGRELASALGAQLHVLHVADDILKRYVGDVAVNLPPSILEDIEGAARAEVERLLTDSDRRDLRAVAVLRTSNNPAASIVEHAETSNIDLIVIGSHGRTGIMRGILGSVAERVARTAPCPVLIVHGDRRGDRNQRSSDAAA